MRRVGTELHQQQLNRSVCRRPVMYRVFIWVGARRIQEVMEAKGYIIGTSQVRLLLLCQVICPQERLVFVVSGGTAKAQATSYCFTDVEVQKSKKGDQGY